MTKVVFHTKLACHTFSGVRDSRDSVMRVFSIKALKIKYGTGTLTLRFTERGFTQQNMLHDTYVIQPYRLF